MPDDSYQPYRNGDSGESQDYSQQPSLHSPAQEQRQVHSVGQLLAQMRFKLELTFQQIWVEGEISGFLRHSSGHIYFTLKDKQGQISCTFFKKQQSGFKLQVVDGMQVRCLCSASLYEPRGQLQLQILTMEAAGQGDLQRQYELLKNRLQQEGLFDNAKKRPIPRFARAVGIITSAQAAALQDILRVFERRSPWIKLYLLSVPVQGQGSAQKIAAAIRAWSDPRYALPSVDAIIVARGGGSLEDLWSFNEEPVVRAVAQSRIPIVSGVGHESDVTLIDFASDLRAATPTAAAEILAAEKQELLTRLQAMGQRLGKLAEFQLQRRWHALQLRRQHKMLQAGAGQLLESQRLQLQNRQQYLRQQAAQYLQQHRQILLQRGWQLQSLAPARILEQRQQKIAQHANQLRLLCGSQLQALDKRLQQSERMLRALGPQAAFERGFSIVYDRAGNIVRSIHEAKKSQALTIAFHDGNQPVRCDDNSLPTANTKSKQGGAPAKAPIDTLKSHSDDNNLSDTLPLDFSQ